MKQVVDLEGWDHGGGKEHKFGIGCRTNKELKGYAFELLIQGLPYYSKRDLLDSVTMLAPIELMAVKSTDSKLRAKALFNGHKRLLFYIDKRFNETVEKKSQAANQHPLDWYLSGGWRQVYSASSPRKTANAKAYADALQEIIDFEGTTQEILEFEFRLTRGKQALGEGQSSIGQRLPEYLHACGLHQIQVKMNNNSALKLPPYERAFDDVETNMLREAQAANNVLCHGSNYDNALRYFLAGNGSSERFAELWKAVFEYQRRKLELLESGQLFSAGGFIHYLQWARKPL